MPALGKVYAVRGTGIPLLERDLLLVSILLDLGYRLIQGTPNFEQGEDRTARDVAAWPLYWIFLFEASTHLAYSDDVARPVRLAADMIRGAARKSEAGDTLPMEIATRRAVYERYDPGTAPAKALAALAPPDSLLETHVNVLHTIAATDRHIRLPKQGRAGFYLVKAGEDIEAQIARIDGR